jgi:hypothetical protein
MSKKTQKKNECPLGGDSRKCEECAYYPDYEFNSKTGECETKELEVKDGKILGAGI